MKCLRHRMVVLGLTLLAAITSRAETLTLTGSVTNTTHNMSAPLRFDLEWSDDSAEVSGFMQVEAPLTEGRWPVTGRRRGRWVELQVEQNPGTRTILRGLLDGRNRLAGTFLFGGGGQIVQFGRFDCGPVATVAAQPVNAD